MKPISWATALVALASCATSSPSLSVADVAVSELDGREASLGAVRGQPALIYLFTTGCDTCLADMDKLRALHQEFSQQGLRVVGVAMDPGGARFVRPFTASLELPFPVVVAGEPLRRGETALGTISAVPRILIVDRRARVVVDRCGVVPYGELAAAVRKVM